VAAVAAIAAAYVWAGRGTPEASADDSSQSPQTSQTTGTDESSSPPADPSPEEARQQMDAFITSYLTTVTSDPRAAFDQLTPEFQKASGGYQGYIGWWGQVQSAELANVDSNPSDRTVAYTVNYVMKTGRTTTSRVRLQLQRKGDEYLIAGEG
jgi:hypothetical protein